MDKSLYDDDGFLLDPSPRRNMIAFDIGDGKTIAEVSFENNVKLSTIYQWMNEPDFVSKIEGQRNDKLNNLIYGTGLQAMTQLITGNSSDRAKVDAYKNIVELRGSDSRMLADRLKNEKLVKEMRGENQDNGLSINITLPDKEG